MIKRGWPYLLVFGTLFLILALVTSENKPPVKWHKTYRQKDKIPFGSHACLQILKRLPVKRDVRVVNLPLLQSPQLKNAQNTTYFFLDETFNMDEAESKRLMDFVARGNTAFICATSFSLYFEDSTQVDTRTEYSDYDWESGKFRSDSTRKFTVKFLNPLMKGDYSYDKYFSYSYFSGLNNNIFTTLAADDSSHAVMVSRKLGKGKIILFSLPDVFTNFYMVNHPSRQFAYNALSYADGDTFWWDEYYKYYNSNSLNPFRFMIENDALYRAFWIAVFATLFFMIFGMKRNQRPIPVIRRPQNSTIQFVEVVSNVYRSSSNHKTIALEKIKIFLEFLRSKFQVKTENMTDEDLIRVSRHSGVELNEVKALMKFIGSVQTEIELSESRLVELNRQIENFHQNNKR